MPDLHGSVPSFLFFSHLGASPIGLVACFSSLVASSAAGSRTRIVMARTSCSLGLLLSLRTARVSILGFLLLVVASFSLVVGQPTSECVLCEPARAGDVSALKSAINSLDPASRTEEQRAAALDAADAYGWPALFWAVDSGHEEVVDVLLSAGANPNTFHRGGWNALMWAAGMPSPVGPKLITAMCKHYSADVALTSEESNKMTALMVAAQPSHRKHRPPPRSVGRSKRQFCFSV